MPGDKPTGKAISERIAKLRRLGKSGDAPDTPRKPKSSPTKQTPKKTPSKRKRTAAPDWGSGDEDSEEIGVPVKEETKNEMKEEVKDEATESDESPTKKAKTTTTTNLSHSVAASPSPVKESEYGFESNAFPEFEDLSAMNTEEQAEMW